MHAIWLCYYTVIAADTKKTTIGYCQGMLNVIQHALMIKNFAIDHPVPLEINCKIAVMGGGGQFSSYQKIGLSLFVICLFFGVILPFPSLLCI
jgi:hypothetical protein